MLQVYGTFNYKRNPQNTKRYLFKDNPDCKNFFLPGIEEATSKSK